MVNRQQSGTRLKAATHKGRTTLTIRAKGSNHTQREPHEGLGMAKEHKRNPETTWSRLARIEVHHPRQQQPINQSSSKDQSHTRASNQKKISRELCSRFRVNHDQNYETRIPNQLLIIKTSFPFKN